MYYFPEHYCLDGKVNYWHRVGYYQYYKNMKTIKIDLESTGKMIKVVEQGITPSKEDETFFKTFGLENISMDEKDNLIADFWKDFGFRIQNKISGPLCNNPSSCYFSYEDELEKYLDEIVINWLGEEDGLLPFSHDGIDLRDKVLKKDDMLEKHNSPLEIPDFFRNESAE